MLNQNLRITELQKSLEKYIDVIDMIQEEILGEQKRPLVNDKKRLGLIHHALNVENYGKSEFRFHLLEHAPDEFLISYLQKLGLIKENQIDPQKRLELIKKASLLKWDENKETEIFVESFGYGEELIPKKIEQKKDEKIIQNHQTVLEPLWEYQSKIFYKAVDLAEISSKRFIILMPTGAGKTKTAMEVVVNFLNEGLGKKEPRQVLWIADKEELCEQAVDSFTKIWPHSGKFPIKKYNFWGDSKSAIFEDNSIIISTYGKLRNIAKKKMILPDLIVCDEAHNAVARTYKETIESISEQQTRIIGLTATPIRTNDTETEELMEFFDNTMLLIDFENEENAIEYLQKRKFLSYYNAHTIPSEVRFRVSRELLKLIEEDRDLPSKFLQEIAQNEIRNLVIAKLLHKLGTENIKVLYFSPTIEQSKLMCALLISFGFNAAHIDGNTPTEYRKDVIKKFRNKEIKILCNFGIFATGFDDPKIDAVVIGRPTTSLVLHTQMIGRGMRGEKMGGTKTFDLYRISDELPGIVLADNYFKDIWGYDD